MSGVVYGLQPVLEALRGEKRIERVWVSRGEGVNTRRVREACESLHIRVEEATRDELDRRAGTPKHQGVVAALETVAIADLDLEAILDRAKQAGEPPLVVLLDSIQDPQNLGAILRSAYGLGAHGVVIPKDRAAQVTPAVIRASAGAALHLPVVQVVNLKHALERLVEAGVWSAAAVMDGPPAYEVAMDGPLALVIGGEAKGVRPTLARQCDHRVSIPLAHNFDSLNASVAAGVLLYEARRQRRARGDQRA